MAIMVSSHKDSSGSGSCDCSYTCQHHDVPAERATSVVTMGTPGKCLKVPLQLVDPLEVVRAIGREAVLSQVVGNPSLNGGHHHSYGRHPNGCLRCPLTFYSPRLISDLVYGHNYIRLKSKVSILLIMRVMKLLLLSWVLLRWLLWILGWWSIVLIPTGLVSIILLRRGHVISSICWTIITIVVALRLEVALVLHPSIGLCEFYLKILSHDFCLLQ